MSKNYILHKEKLSALYESKKNDMNNKTRFIWMDMMKK